MNNHYKIGDVFDLIGGGTPSTKQKEYWGEGTPWFSSADIDAAGNLNYRRCVTPLGLEDSTTNVVPKGTIVVVTRVGLGKVVQITEPMCFSQDMQALLPKKKDLEYNHRFLFYQLSYIMQSYKFKGQGTTISGITKKQLADALIYLPAVEKQDSIVSCIEALFSQLDASEATLRTVKDQLAVYRQAVLKDAFSSFTEKVPIRGISSIVTSGSRGWAQYYSDKGARFIRITDLTRDRIILKNDSPQYVVLPDGAEGKRTYLQPHDVLVLITADLGSIALIPNDIGEAYVNQHIAMIRFLNPQQAKFMSWYLKSDYGQKELLKNKRGNGKLGLGLDDIRDTTVPIVSDDVANAAVRSIDARLSICESIEKSILQCFQQSQALRQSILKQVLKGDLCRE